VPRREPSYADLGSVAASVLAPEMH
jgi:hypothetical protein